MSSCIIVEDLSLWNGWWGKKLSAQTWPRCTKVPLSSSRLLSLFHPPLYQYSRTYPVGAHCYLRLSRIRVNLHHFQWAGDETVSWNSTAPLALVVGATNGPGHPRSNWVRQVMLQKMSHLVVWLQGMWWGNTWVTCMGKASSPPCVLLFLFRVENTALTVCAIA